MKTVLGGLLITLIGGFAAAVLFQQYQRWETSNAARVEIVADLRDALIINRHVLDALKSKRDPGGIIRIFRIENTGSEDLDKFTLYLGSSGSGSIFDADLIVTSSTDALSPVVKNDSGNFSISYNLLRHGESATFWALMSNTDNPTINSDRKGLSITNLNWRNDNNTFDLSDVIAIVFAVGVIFLIIGIAVSEIINRWVLRKIGFEPKEIAELFKNEMSKKEKTEAGH